MRTPVAVADLVADQGITRGLVGTDSLENGFEGVWRAPDAVAAEVDDLTEKVAAQPEVERDLLEAAANKPVTDAVDAAVRKLLGL